nr:cation:proton antiporter [Kitasatospora sp. CB01950]
MTAPADIAIILLIGLLLSPLRTRLRQPVVVGEIAVGVVLGPSVLGLLPGDLPHLLFPPEARTHLAGCTAAMALLVRPLLRRLLDRPAAGGHPLLALLALGSGVLLSAWTASRLGVHPAVGAFVFGLVMPRDVAQELRHAVEAPLRNAGALFVPVFFALTGLSVDLGGPGFAGLAAASAFLAVAWGSRIAGVRVAARLVGVPRHEAVAVAVLLDTKGLGEVVILTIGRDVGIIGDRLFTILLVAAVAATLPVNPLVRRLARSHRAPAGDAAALAHQQPNPAGTTVEGPGGKLPH